MTGARRVLQRVFGLDEFRPGQREIIAAVLDGRDTIGVMPTGAGKIAVLSGPGCFTAQHSSSHHLPNRSHNKVATDWTNDYAVSRDGQRFLISNVMEEALSPITVITPARSPWSTLNWSAEK